MNRQQRRAHEAQRVAADPTVEQIMRGCAPHLLADYQDALRAGEGTGPDDLAGLVTEKRRDPPLPPGMLETETGVYARAALLADLEKHGSRELAAKLRAWTPKEPGFFPVVFAVRADVGIVPLRLTRAAVSKGGDA